MKELSKKEILELQMFDTVTVQHVSGNSQDFFVSDNPMDLGHGFVSINLERRVDFMKYTACFPTDKIFIDNN